MAVLAAGAAGCSAPAGRPGLAPSGFPAPAVIRVQLSDRSGTAVRSVRLEDYVEATILSEFAPASGDPAVVEQMLEVQAIVSRTYAVAHLTRHARDGFDLCSTTHCQLYDPGRLQTSRWSAAAGEAAARTAGQVLWFDARPASALYHADCGGSTSRASDVWGGSGFPYLAAIRDDGPASDAHTAWTFDAPVEDVRAALDNDQRTAIGPRLDGLTVLDRDGAGRAQRVVLHGQHDRIVRGEDLREVLARRFGARSVRSTWFDVRRETDRLHFEGRGFGHGVGLCQAGALARLRAGASPRDVLRFYYPGTSLVTLVR